MNDIVIVAIVTGLVSLLTTAINKSGEKKHLFKAINRIAEGLTIGLENDKVIFKALREHEINGESEKQERKMEEYLRDCTSNGYRP